MKILFLSLLATLFAAALFGCGSPEEDGAGSASTYGKPPGMGDGPGGGKLGEASAASPRFGSEPGQGYGPTLSAGPSQNPGDPNVGNGPGQGVGPGG